MDDAKRFTTIECVKKKSDAAQAVINYLAHLKTQGQHLKGIQIDCGKEFVNEKLENWGKELGMEIHYTVPYSPSQNSIAECMNCTLVEHSQAMIIANDLPEFLLDMWSSMPLISVINHTPNIYQILHLTEAGAIKNQVFLIYMNLVHLYGFYCRDKRLIAKCNPNINSTFMLILMMALEP